jgi:hypothetical protein
LGFTTPYKNIKNRTLPGPGSQLVPGPGRSWGAAYLRAAQAYMLISMPTGTSTIFGTFQVIHSLQAIRHDFRA